MEKVEKNGNELKQRNTSNGIGPTIANQLRTHTKKNALAKWINTTNECVNGLKDINREGKKDEMH